MSRRNTPHASASTSPYAGHSPSDENIFYIPIPASGEIVLQTLTREQRHLLDNMGKPSPPLVDESPETPPSVRRSINSPRRHNLGPSPVVSASTGNTNPAYLVSPRVQDSIERVRIHKERLAAMRGSRTPCGVGTSVSPPETPIARVGEVIGVPRGVSTDSGSYMLDVGGDARILGCGSSKYTSWMGSDEGKAGIWEPLFSGMASEGGPAVEGLGISVWTEDDPTRQKLFRGGGSGEVIGPAVGGEGDGSDTRGVAASLNNEGADTYADDGSKTVRIPTNEETTCRDTSPVPEMEIGRSEGSSNLISSPTLICWTGPVSRLILLLAWGWRSPVLVQHEGQASYLGRGIEMARKRMGVARE